MALECPVCSATEKGDGDPFDSPRSVEAHISASRDEEHRGKQGKDFRDEIGDSMADGGGVQSSADGDTVDADAGDVPTGGAPAVPSQTDGGGTQADGMAVDGSGSDSTSGAPDTPGAGGGTVEAFGVEMTHGEALDLVTDVLEDPGGHGIATASMVRRLESRIPPQCIECGRRMDPVLAEDVVSSEFTVKKELLGGEETVPIAEDDHVCWHCDVLHKGTDGSFIFGSDSANPGKEAVPDDGPDDGEAV